MGMFDGIGEFLSGGLLTGTSPMDIADPANLFHEGNAQREANKQWQLEYDLSNKNYYQQVEAYNYQKELNALNMEREDNAVQRRVADLKAAGLSPTLAAGSAAGATAVHAGTAPQQLAPSDVKARAAMFREEQAKDRLALAMNMMGNMANVSRTSAEIQLLKAQKEGQDIQNLYMSDELAAKIEGIQLDNQRKIIDNEVSLNVAGYKVAQEANKVRQQDIDFLNSCKDTVLKDDVHLKNTFDIAVAAVEAKYAESHHEQKLEKEKAEVIALAISIEQASVDLEETKRNNKIYAEMYPNIPRNVLDRMTGNYLGIASFGFGQSWASAKEWAKSLCSSIGYSAKSVGSKMFGFMKTVFGGPSAMY